MGRVVTEPMADNENNGSGWWVDYGSDPLETYLSQAVRLFKSELDEVGKRDRNWVMYYLSWDQVAVKLNSVRELLLGKDGRPDWVKVD